MSTANMGSSIDDFMKKEGIFEEAQAQAIDGVIAWQLAEERKARQRLPKAPVRPTIG